MSASASEASTAVSTTSPLVALQLSSSRSSIDLFPTGATGTQSAATATSSTSSGGGRAPSLYLIVFLSILVLLLVTSFGIAVRAVHFRRRYRRAIARGEVPSRWGDNMITEPYPDSWWRPMVMNRFFGVDPDGDHFDAMMRGDWGPHGTRRRKAKKDYGEVPILFEADLSAGEDETSVSWSEKQPLAVALSSKAQGAVLKREANAGQFYDNETPIPELQYQPGTNVNTTSANPRDAELIQVRYLIRMPESDAAISSRSQPDEYGEIISHGPIEMGVWQPRLETERTRAQDDIGKGEVEHREDWKP